MQYVYISKLNQLQLQEHDINYLLGTDDGLEIKRSWAQLMAVPLHVMILSKLFTHHVPLTPSSIIWQRRPTPLWFTTVAIDLVMH